MSALRRSPCTAPRTAPLRRARRLWIPLVGGLSVGACGGDAPVAVEAGGATFTADEVLGLPEDRQRLLGELAVFAQAVADSALADLGRPWVEARLTDLGWQRLQAQRALDSAGVGDDVLLARYRTAPQLELTVRHLLVFSERYETDATRDAARAKAEAALARILDGEPFPQVAAEVSEEPGAESREGLLTPGREGAWVPEFWRAATDLEPGEVSPVVETQYGFHVLRLEARDTVDFAEARSGVALEVAELMGLRAGDVPRPAVPDDLPEPPAVDRLFDPAAPDSEPLAAGDGWSVTLGDLRDAVATLPYAEWSRLRRDPGALAPAWLGAVEAAVAEQAAAAAGIETDEADRATVEREFADRGEQWALQLRLATGGSAESIRAAALAALANSGQNASIARDALRAEWGGLLHRFRPIRVGETPPGPGA